MSAALGIGKHLPYFTEGLIVKGFGRGSRELGFPTANFSEEVIAKLPSELVGGIYWGLAAVEQGPVYGMVMSIGWNPFYKDEKRAMETHILHEFPGDLYGKLLKVAILGYLRPEQNFESLADLVRAIQNDIRQAEEKLKEPAVDTLRRDKFFAQV